MAGIIGICTAELGRYAQFYASVFALVRPPNTKIAMARGAVISQSRNDISEAAMEMGAEWVLFLDDDQMLKPDTLTRLLAADRDIVSACYVQRQVPFHPVIMDDPLPDGRYPLHILEADAHGLIPVSAVGAGCLLVKTQVFTKLERPFWRLGQFDPSAWDEDVDFSQRVRDAGFTIWCDLDAPIGHHMIGTVWPERDPQNGWRARFERDPAEGVIADWPMPTRGRVPLRV